MKLKKEMTSEEMTALIKAFEKWERDNLEMPAQYRERTAADTYGLPYTSSGAYAGLWNTNTPATMKDNDRMTFDGIALSESGEPVACFTQLDQEGNEVKDVYIKF
jgi:hypothetical protein